MKELWSRSEISIYVYTHHIAHWHYSDYFTFFFFFVLLTQTGTILERSQHVISLDIWKTDCIVSHAVNCERATVFWEIARINSFPPLKSQHSWLFTHHCLGSWKTQRFFYWYDDYWLKWLDWLAFIDLRLISKDYFILEINFDLIWSLYAEEKKWWGRRKWWIFFLIKWKA